MNQIVNECEAMYKDGNKDAIEHYLVYKVGWEKDVAKDFIEDLVKEWDKETTEAAATGPANIGPPMFG